MRNTELASDQFYHIYNRGTEKRKIFMDNSDCRRFLLCMQLMNDEKNSLMISWRDYKKTYPNETIESFLRLNLRKRNPLVEIICFSLIPNHFHFILKQLSEKGIEKFMHRLGTGYTMYFNKKYARSGALFQGRFKSSHIKATHHLLYLSVYVNCNAEIHGIAEAENYHWSSFQDFFQEGKNDIFNGKVITSHFKDGKDYKIFAKKNIEVMKQKKLDEKVVLE